MAHDDERMLAEVDLIVRNYGPDTSGPTQDAVAAVHVLLDGFPDLPTNT